MVIKGLFSIFEAVFSTFCMFTEQNKCAYQNQHTKIFQIANFQLSLNLVLCCVIYVAGARTADIRRFQGFRRPKYEFLDRNLFVFHMRSRAPRPPQRLPMMYVVIERFSHELQTIYVVGARIADFFRFRGFTGFRQSPGQPIFQPIFIVAGGSFTSGFFFVPGLQNILSI